MDGANIFERLGVKTVINAAGNTTSHGGSTLTPSVKASMEAVEHAWCDMQELLEATGNRIAELLEVEAAYPTSGGYAALALAAAACMTEGDEVKHEQLPDTSGLKCEFVLQKAQEYVFDRAYTIAGGRLVLVGEEIACTEAQLGDAICGDTAAVVYYVKQHPEPNELTLEAASGVARENGVPIIVDAASRIWPLDYFKQMARSGDLVCFGGKYFGAPQSAGFVVGSKERIVAVRRHGFVSDKPVGRAMKLDIEEVVGLLTGIEDWFSMDHDDRFAEFDARMSTIINGLEGAPNVTGAQKIETPRHPGVTLHVSFDKESLGKSADAVVDELYENGVRIQKQDETTLNICVHTLNDGEDRQVAQGLRQVLTGGSA